MKPYTYVTASIGCLACLSFMNKPASADETITAHLPAQPSAASTATGPIQLEVPDIHKKCATDSTTDNKKIRVGIGAWIPTGSSAYSPGFSLTSEFVLAPGKSGDLVGVLALDYFSTSASAQGVSASADAILFPLELEYQFHLGNGFYAGPGIGYCYEAVTATASGSGASVSVAGSTSAFIYSAALGYTSRSLFAELRYMGSNSVDMQGISLVIGGRF